MSLKEELRGIVSLSQAAERVGCSRQLVKMAAQAGAFETCQVGDMTLCRLADVRAWHRTRGRADRRRKRTRARVRRAVLEADLSAFPARTQRALRLRYEDELTREQVAAELQVSVGRVDQIVGGVVDALLTGAVA